MYFWDFFLFLGGLAQILRAFCHYNLLLLIDKKKPVNIIKFYDNLQVYALLSFMFYLIPLKKKKFLEYEKRVRLINLLLLLTYLSLIIYFIGFYIGFAK